MTAHEPPYRACDACGSKTYDMDTSHGDRCHATECHGRLGMRWFTKTLPTGSIRRSAGLTIHGTVPKR